MTRRPRNFNPRTPRGVRLDEVLPGDTFQVISIHAPREGCDDEVLPGDTFQVNFNPRTPRGVRRGICPILPQPLEYISIHAPREGCDYPTSPRRISCTDFNPRTPRGVRRGGGRCTDATPSVYFNPRTPRGVRPPLSVLPQTNTFVFQSTHPARGATEAYRGFYRILGISIHAPREGCDIEQPGIGLGHLAISIHAPREGCDGSTVPPPLLYSNFNPRTPRGVRRHRSSMTRRALVFQSTHPARGATLCGRSALLF